MLVPCGVSAAATDRRGRPLPMSLLYLALRRVIDLAALRPRPAGYEELEI